MDEATFHGIQFTLEVSTLLTILGAIWWAAKWTAKREEREANLAADSKRYQRELEAHVIEDRTGFANVDTKLNALSISAAVANTKLTSLETQANESRRGAP